jgi:hypothetical protein
MAAYDRTLDLVLILRVAMKQSLDFYFRRATVSEAVVVMLVEKKTNLEPKPHSGTDSHCDSDYFADFFHDSTSNLRLANIVLLAGKAIIL